MEGHAEDIVSEGYLNTRKQFEFDLNVALLLFPQAIYNKCPSEVCAPHFR